MRCLLSSTWMVAAFPIGGVEPAASLSGSVSLVVAAAAGLVVPVFRTVD